MKIYRHPIFQVGDILMYKDNLNLDCTFHVMSVNDKYYKLRYIGTLEVAEYSLSAVHALLQPVL